MTQPLMLDARRVLFGGLIDYAGLFPPASLDMDGAVEEYRDARSGDHAWMLGRFICTASRLEELARTLTSSMASGEPPWPVSVVLDDEIATAAAAAQTFDAHMGNAAEVVLTEARIPPDVAGEGSDDVAAAVKRIATAATSISPTVTAFLEVPRTAGWEQAIGTTVDAIAAAAESLGRPVGAKFRCGGTTSDAFPSSEQIARFLAACRSAVVPYKVTAGLHHPVRHHDEQLGVMMHGFLNVLVAGAMSAAGSREAAIVAALNETEPAAFRIGPASLAWADHRFGVSDLRALRDARFPSYGSCSFDEPVGDLAALGLVDA